MCRFHQNEFSVHIEQKGEKMTETNTTDAVASITNTETHEVTTKKTEVAALERRDVSVMTDEVEETDKFLYTDVLMSLFNRVFSGDITQQVEMDLMTKM